MPAVGEMTIEETVPESASATSPGRRSVLSILLAALGAVFVRPGRVQAGVQASKPRGCKWGMAIDLDKCTACQGCVVACRTENNVPVAGPVDTEKGRAIFWMNLLALSEGEYPEMRLQLLPAPCNHCEDPPCIKVCPVGATSQSEDGIIQQIPGRCIGCRLCEVSCPYTRRYFNWSDPAWPEGTERALNPDVAPRAPGVMEKCTFCHHRIRAARNLARAKGRSLTDDDVRKLPACAASCPADAIVFGDLNDPESEVSRQARSPRAFRLLEEMGTHPKVIYLREAKWQE